MNTPSQRLVTLLVALLLVIPAAQLPGQNLTSGDVAGTVTDSSGAVIAEANVTIKNANTGQAHTVATSATGAYRFSLLQPGDYIVTVDARGFSHREAMVSVAVGVAVSQDVKLTAAN